MLQISPSCVCRVWTSSKSFSILNPKEPNCEHLNFGYHIASQGYPSKFPHTHKGDSSKFPCRNSHVYKIQIFPVRRLHGNLNFLGTSKEMLHYIGKLTWLGNFLIYVVCMHACMYVYHLFKCKNYLLCIVVLIWRWRRTRYSWLLTLSATQDVNEEWMLFVFGMVIHNDFDSCYHLHHTRVELKHKILTNHVLSKCITNVWRWWSYFAI